MADFRKLTETLSVAPQLLAGDADQLKMQGYRSVLCNRPDYEAVEQPTYKEIAGAIDALGITTEFQPVSNQAITDEDVDAFAAHVAQLEAPVLAYCRSGTRCTVLWALSEAGNRPIDEILNIASQAGYALDALRPRLEARELSAKK